MIEYKEENYIFKNNERVSEEELQGDLQVLNSPLIEKAFQFILGDFTPKHDKVIFSLCTASRPYLKSRKWQILLDCFEEDADLIVCSNGGIIPLEYMNCYPFMTYDAPHNKDCDELYKQVFITRLNKFLDKFKYDKIVLLFAPTTRNYAALQENAPIPNSVLYPTEEMWEKISTNEDLYIGINKRYAVISCCVLQAIEKYFGITSKYLQDLISKYTSSPILPMHQVLVIVFDALPLNVGYSIIELKEMIKSVCPLYSNVYMEKSIRSNTDNINTNYGLVTEPLFHLQDGLFYKYDISGNYPVKRKKLF